MIQKTNLEDALKKLATTRDVIETEEVRTTFNSRDINALKSQAELASITIENKIKAEELHRRIQDREQRKTYATYVFYFLVGYMLFVFSILFFCGLNAWGFGLSDSVLIAIVTTTTANVIGIFAFVMMYLFNTGTKKK